LNPEFGMELNFEKAAGDARGKILFLNYGDKKINIVEIKRGFSRGGHYHTFKTRHFLLSGTIEYREKDLSTNMEKISKISAPTVIEVPPMTAHLLTALDDTVFVEEFGENYSATEYPEYRKIVTEKIQ
jgi:dTDP-4-dehydrorhamnose 3,5-epimerase-like enzyme